MLKDCEPNIPEYLDLLLDKTDILMVKTSPLLDITAGLRELKHVLQIHSIAVKNEVKELLWILSKKDDTKALSLFAVNLSSDFDVPVTLDFDALQFAEATFDEPQTYLYEPNAALLKLGAFNWISEHYKLDKLAANTQLYTSEKLIDFPGRRFKIKDSIPYSKKTISQLLKGTQAHITTRNFKASVADLRKKFKIKSGGDRYIFFTTLENGKSLMLDCEKI